MRDNEGNKKLNNFQNTYMNSFCSSRGSSEIFQLLKKKKKREKDEKANERQRRENK